MAIWGKLFGSDKVIEAGIRAGDAVWFTDEEKSEWRLRLLKAYEPFRIAQRWLAVITSAPFVALHCVAALHVFAAGWIGGPLGKQVHEAALNVMELNTDTLGIPVAVILGFYFAGGAFEGALRAKSGRE